jgi:hypothetical protein
VERALNLENLVVALGEPGRLPTAEEVQQRLAETEIALFVGNGNVDEDLMATAWYLHAVGAARPQLERYPRDRQLRASQVAGHIFDLALAAADRPEAVVREITFAGQVSYIRGGLDPNALALYRRRLVDVPSLIEAPGEVSLDIGSALLALDRPRLFVRIEDLRAEAERLRQIGGFDDLIQTPYGSASRVIQGTWELLIHLTYGRLERLQRARNLFDDAIHPPFAEMDLDSRWVAAHLRDIADDLGRTSIWSLQPPDMPSGAGRAMTLGDPPVMSLWPPQYKLLSLDPSPLRPDVRRLVLSFPTSAGKTLIAQYLVAAHVAAGAGSACVVAPTHSLGRELQRDLDRRLAILGEAAVEAGPLGIDLPTGSSAVVMTPEKFAAHLRNEPEEMLNTYSLYLVDEAHLVGDADRGWVLESALGLLHDATRTTHHRIVLLSAAIGNRDHVSSWLAVDGDDAVTFHDEWRGPRRAHALLSTKADWDNAELVERARSNGLRRQRIPLHGSVLIRTAPGKSVSLSTTEPIGTLVLAERNGAWSKQHQESDAAYRMRAQMATMLGDLGSVLVVESTKLAAQRTATAIADLLQDDDNCASLVDLATRRLHEAHPLVSTLRRGVGFHHSALPDDIQAELEDGLRKGPLNYLVATTTLIEGVNFPVRTVLIGERGYPSKDGFVSTLDGPKLINAFGRAGRAGRETEGWIVIWLNEEVTDESFRLLEIGDQDLVASSMLASPLALDALAEFEELVRTTEDAVLEVDHGPVAGFISHVWFIATALQELNELSKNPAAVSIESTLAWQQLTPENQTRWRAVADGALEAYEATPDQQRRRWAKTGTSLASAAQLDELAAEVSADVGAVADRSDPLLAIEVITRADRLERLLGLSEARSRGFRPRRNASATDLLAIDLRALIHDWLVGKELGELGETYLMEIEDETYRYEQLSEFIAQVFEHLLPWLLATVIGWINADVAPDDQLCPDLPAYLRYGVHTKVALMLCRGGARSRRLAHRVSAVAPIAEPDGVREWLASGEVYGWAAEFDASPGELADLLAFARLRNEHTTSRVLEGEAV